MRVRRSLSASTSTSTGLLIAAAIAPLVLVASCSSAGSTSSSESTASSKSTASTESTAAAVSTGDTVRLLAHDSFVVSDALVAEFEATTGYDLEILAGGDAGTMTAGAILAAGAPTADVIFGVDNTLVSRAVEGGVFAPYASSNTAALLPELADDTSGGLVTPVDYGDVCVNIDDAYFTDKGLAPPTTLDDLIDPQYAGLLVVEDPAASSPGLAFLLATISRYGDDWPAYWAALRDNQVAVAGSWTDAYLGQFSGGGDGDRPLVVSYATSPPAEIVYAEEPKPVTPSTSVMVDGCYRQVEFTGVLAGTEKEAGAQAVIDWLTSEAVQSDIPLSMFVFPARAGITLPEVFVDFAAVVPAPLQLDSAQVAEGLPGWLEEWGTVMSR